MKVLKEEREEKQNKNKKINLKIIIISVIIILCVFLIVFLVISKKEDNLVGNTIGNIRNYGYVVTDNKYLYFMSPSDEGSSIGIRKIEKNNLAGTSTMLIEGDWQIAGLNYMDGYLYFITMTDSSNENSEDTIDNKIHKMKVDGSNDTVINDNEFNNDCYEIYVVKDKLYYIGTDECVYYMGLDGNNKTKLNDNASGFIGITEKYIIFNKKLETESTDATNSDSSNETSSSTINYETCIMDLDGKNEHAISSGKKLYNVNIIGDYIYYETVDGHISKIKIDGTEDTLISDEEIYSMVATDEGIFYYNYYQVDGTNAGVALYKMDLDGSNITELTKLSTYSEMLCEFDNWLFYSDSDSSYGSFKLISKDGKQTVVLYNLDLSIYNTDDSNTTNESDANSTTEIETESTATDSSTDTTSEN